MSTELFYLEKAQDMNETKYTKFTNKGGKKRMIVSGMSNIILKKKIKGKFSLINKIWKHNFYVVIVYS